MMKKSFLIAVPVAVILTQFPAKGLEVGGIKLDESKSEVNIATYTDGWQWNRKGSSEVVPIQFIRIDTGNGIYTIRHDVGGPYQGIGIHRIPEIAFAQQDTFILFINEKPFRTEKSANEKMEIKKSGTRGDILYSWENSMAAVSFIFSGFYGDPNLYMTIRLKPKMEIRRLYLRINTCPGGFGGRKPPEVTVSVPEENLVGVGNNYLSKNFEPAPEFIFIHREKAIGRNKLGGAGIIMKPEQVNMVSVYNGGYVETTLHLSPDTRELNLAFSEIISDSPYKKFPQYLSAARKILKPAAEAKSGGETKPAAEMKTVPENSVKK